MSIDARSVPELVQTFPEAVAWWAALTPEAPALEAPGWDPVSFRALWQTVCRLRAELHAVGIGRGSRLALLVPDGLSLAVVALAAISSATVVPIDPHLRAPERRRLLARLGADALLTCVPGTEAEGFAWQSLRLLTLHGSEGPSVAGLRVAGPPCTSSVDWLQPQPSDIAYVFHTSGTTGEPRAVPHRHDTYMAWARATIRDFGIHPTDRTLGLGTLTQAAGEIPLRHALVAGSVWVATDRSSAVSLLDRLDAASPTWLYLPAGIVGLIDRELSREPGRSLSRSLRFVRFTSGGISVERLVEMEARFGIPIYPEYSSNEAGIIARVTPLPSPIRPGSVGKPFLEVEIVDERGAPLPVGSSGEIVVRGLTVSCGDLDAGEPERECFLPGGWLRTGDLGYQDSDGFLFVTGRMSGIINRGGAKILPDEVDAALEAHPAVAEAAAFGVPDDRLGEDIVAAVVLIADASVSPRQLRAWLLARISAHKMPRRFWFVSELPRTPTGKVRRGVLTRLWTDARTSEPVAMSDEQFGYAPSPSAPSQR